MRIATWNVNSVKQRHGRLLEWLDSRRPDVVCLQELKMTDDAFATLIGPDLTERGYAFATAGQPQWNGSAVLSKVGLDDVVIGIPGAPGFPEVEGRAVSAVCGKGSTGSADPGIRVHSLYTPNGREIDSDHYTYKLAWLDALRAQVAADSVPQLVCGDMNIAPTDEDVFDPAAFVGHTHVTAPERAALAALEALGLRDVVRERWPHEQVFSYWDYRAGMFNKNLGMRIDLILASGPVADRTAAAWIDRQARKGKGPSDHAPVMLDLDTAPDGDIGPMVPPPSAGRVAPRGVKLPHSAD
ncbi:exodeoxyribonuclease III [Tsukamurella serpentis]